MGRRAPLLLFLLGPAFIPALPRRQLAPLLAAVALPPAASAEQGWQLKLPRSWRTFEQNAQPPPDVKKAAALVVAGNPEQGGALKDLKG